MNFSTRSWRTSLLVGAAIAFTPLLTSAETVPITRPGPSGEVAPAEQDDDGVDRSPKRSVGTVAADAAISAKVKAALLGDSEIAGLKINVDTFRGVVTLSGKADDPAHLSRATSLAEKVDGVVDVVNRVEVAH